MRKVLVPTDLSIISENALSLAVDIATKSKSEIHLVNFHKHPYGKSFSAMGEIEKVDEEGNIFTIQLIRKNLADLQALADKYPVDIFYQVYDQSFTEGVEDFIQENGIDLIVMGTTGEETTTEFFTGNHTQQVIEMADCPVISVREHDGRGNLSKIVLGVDFDKDKRDNNLKAIAYVNDVAAGLKAEVHLVHVSKNLNDQENDLKKLQNFVEDYGLLNAKLHVVANDDERAGLLKFAHEVNAAMVTVLTHADGGFFRVFEQNLSEEMSKESDLPVMTINLHKV